MVTTFFRTLALALALTGGASAATFDMLIEGGGKPQVYALDNGNFLGLWGFDTRRRTATGGTITTADITSAFSRGSSSIRGYYYGDSTLNGAAPEFTRITSPLNLADGTRYYGALWIEWAGDRLTFRFGRKTRTLGSDRVTRAGDPLASVAAVPLPMAGL
ncbi:MAG: hypothetical protein WBA25_18620, partial [Jannaschia sp.]